MFQEKYFSIKFFLCSKSTSGETYAQMYTSKVTSHVCLVSLESEV